MSSSVVPTLPPELPPASDRPAGGVAPDPDELPVTYRINRIRATALRFRWWVVGLTVAGLAAGLFAARSVRPVFDARATLLLADDRPTATMSGPIREAVMLEADGWMDVLRSNRVVDSAVVKTRLHIRTGKPGDDSLMTAAATATTYIAGAYVLEVGKDGASYVLRGGDEKTEIERGTLPDSVGRKVGLLWWVPKLGGEREVPFFVARVRDASQELRDRLRTYTREQAQFITVELSGTDPSRLADLLNVWLDEFITVAGELKRKRTTDYVTTLESQLEQAQTRLRTAESSLETMRASALTSPLSAGPIAGGIEATRDPLMREYLANRLALEEVRRDRDALAQLLREPGGVSIEALSALPAILENNAALRAALAELSANEAKLRTARQFYGEEHASVRDLVLAIDGLKRQTLPQLARAALDQIGFREQALEKSVGSFSSELRRVPERSIEEARRRREVAVAEELYTSVLQRYNEARLGAAVLSADLSIFDRARAPRSPTSNPRRTVAAGGLMAGLALAALLVVLMDFTDRRLRFPEQVTHELKLDIAGFVPRMPEGSTPDALAAAQAVEAFRSLRLRLQTDATPGVPLRLVVSSAGIGDGKSLVAQNLAISLAESGLRTLLVDGDVRRGLQHLTFGAPQSPGLAELLGGTAALADVLVKTEIPNLTLLPSGARSRRVPELLERGRLAALFDHVGDFDVVLIDSAPLGAGIDAFALGVAAGSMLLVLRVNHTDTKVAAAKLEMLDRMPVQVLGAVLNDVTPSTGFEQYSYYSEYLLPDEASATVKTTRPPTIAQSPSTALTTARDA
ncbi:MAG: polysaccharide biosynthesis tyrosine autokinase [Gemmatimonadaceae bacterium]|nr:polysaccharide biosynthesis tyrosine autokinase [Gemmatimonadaceae bacterium]